MAQKKSAAKKEMSFEEALQDLEGIVKELDQGELKLEESLDKFSQGVALTNFCMQKISSAEEQIDKILQQEQGVWKEKSFMFDNDKTVL